MVELRRLVPARIGAGVLVGVERAQLSWRPPRHKICIVGASRVFDPSQPPCPNTNEIGVCGDGGSSSEDNDGVARHSVVSRPTLFAFFALSYDRSVSPATRLNFLYTADAIVAAPVRQKIFFWGRIFGFHPF